MGTSILILQGHPDPKGTHLCHALADAYARGAKEGGHDVRRIDVGTLDFPLLRSEADYLGEAVPPVIREVQEAVLACTHLVVIFPLWLGTLPALLKALLEQVFRPLFAFEYRERGFPAAKLRGRSARVIVTMGSPVFIYRWFYGAHGVRSLEQGVLRFSGFSPVRRTLFGRVGSVSPEQGARWRAAIESLGRKGL
ncbi:MAG: NAD(P)H-dependent oxidoreductase [Pseudomonadota bacterium]